MSQNKNNLSWLVLSIIASIIVIISANIILEPKYFIKLKKQLKILQINHEISLDRLNEKATKINEYSNSTYEVIAEHDQKVFVFRHNGGKYHQNELDITFKVMVINDMNINFELYDEHGKRCVIIDKSTPVDKTIKKYVIRLKLKRHINYYLCISSDYIGGNFHFDIICHNYL